MQIIEINLWRRDIEKICLLFILTIFVNYYTPSIFGLVLTGIYFYLYLKSNKNNFWIALFLIFYMTPGGIFQGYELHSPGRMPAFTLFSNLSLSTMELFVLLTFGKSLFVHKNNTKYIFRKPTIYLFLYLLLLLYSFLLGIDQVNLILTIRTLIFFSLFYSIPRLIEKDMYLSVILLIIPFSIIDFLGQLSELYTFGNLGVHLRGGINALTESLNKFQTFHGSRTEISPSLNYISFFFCLVFYSIKGLKNKWVFIIIATINFISIFLTATRGWIIAYSIMVILLFVIKNKLNMRSLFSLGLGVVVLILLNNSFPLVNQQLEKSMERLDTVKALAKGDMTAGGTLSRISERGPRVMSKFLESPIFGWGFSNEGIEYNDGHVGNQNVLREGGIIEACLLLYFIGFYINKLNTIRKKLSNRNLLKKSLVVLIIGLLGLLIIHSSSSQIFGFLVQTQWIVLVVIIITFSNYLIIKTISIDSELINKNT